MGVDVSNNYNYTEEKDFQILFWRRWEGIHYRSCNCIRRAVRTPVQCRENVYRREKFPRRYRRRTIVFVDSAPGFTTTVDIFVENVCVRNYMETADYRLRPSTVHDDFGLVRTENARFLLKRSREFRFYAYSARTL